LIFYSTLSANAKLTKNIYEKKEKKKALKY